MSKESFIAFTLGIVVSAGIFWIVSVDKSAWTRSGSVNLLEQTGRVTTSEGVRWYISDNAIITQTMWDALDQLDVEYLMIEDHVILITP